jgi:Zn-dependent protease/CBS domain-containing protein
MFGSSWRLARIAGIEIRIDTSWVVIALLITYSMYIRFTAVFPSLTTGQGVALAIMAAVLFFASVLIHELAHALVSVARGIHVQDITLFLFGGATRAKVDSKGPADEFVIAVVGPLTSLVLGALFWLISSLDGLLSRPVAGAIGYLGWVNLILALFNLVPGFPLDGGRLLRSAVWKATGSLRRATRVASIAGQAFGWLLIVAGVFSLVSGSLSGGIWLAFIGWFLVQAAKSSYEEIQARLILEKLDAEDVMARDLIRIPPDLPLQEAVDHFFLRYDHGAFPVEQDGRTVGLLTLRGVRRVPREDWPSRRVQEVMSSLGEEIVVAPHTRLDTVMGKLEDGGSGRVLVVEDGEVVGIITPWDVARYLQRWRSLEAQRA